MIKGNSPTSIGTMSSIFSLEEAFQLLKYTEGRMLTIVDATTTDPKQREAVKSLVRMSLNENRDVLRRRFEWVAQNPESVAPWEFTPEETSLPSEF